MQRVLVTGATGYLGRHLATRLLTLGYEVAAVVRPTSATERLGGLKGLQILLYGGGAEQMLRLVADTRPHAVFHLAAATTADHTYRDVDPLIEANVLLGAQILEGLRAAGGGLFVSAGTFWQHADATEAYRPNTLYAATKQAFQDILAYYVRCAALRAVTLKLTDIYGPDDPRPKLFSQLKHAQASGVALNMSPGEQRLDLVYVDDAVEAFVHAVRLLKRDPSIAGRSYAVSTGRHLSLREVVATFEAISGHPVPVQWGGRPYRPFEIMTPWRGEWLPGWRPRTTLEQGLERLLSGSGVPT